MFHVDSNLPGKIIKEVHVVVVDESFKMSDVSRLNGPKKGGWAINGPK